MGIIKESANKIYFMGNPSAGGLVFDNVVFVTEGIDDIILEGKYIPESIRQQIPQNILVSSYNFADPDDQYLYSFDTLPVPEIRHLIILYSSGFTLRKTITEALASDTYELDDE